MKFGLIFAKVGSNTSQFYAAAGSLLGLAVHEGTGFPVGKVNMLDLHPLTFREFLAAAGGAGLRAVVDSVDTDRLTDFSVPLAGQLRRYYYVGGMPEAVAAYLGDGTLHDARVVQEEILRSYQLDATKHLSGRDAEHVLAAWESIPAHLSRENKKLVFGQIRDGTRARDYTSAVTWLTQSGIATKVARVSKPGVPLSAYSDAKAFKVFMVDVGLLGAMAGLDESSVVDGSAVFTEFKGALTEQYVCQQLVGDLGVRPYYWPASNSSGEIDFLVQRGPRVAAIEVKAEENLHAKSLRAFKEKNPEVSALRLSLSGYREQDWMRNVPLYAVGNEKLWG